MTNPGCLAGDGEPGREGASLAESEERFRILVEHAPEALVILDVDTGSTWPSTRVTPCPTAASSSWRLPTPR